MQQRRGTVGGSDSSNRLRPVPKLQQGLASKSITVVSGASLVEREKLLEEMIKELLAENSGLKKQLQTIDEAPDNRPSPVSTDTEIAKLEHLGEDKKKLEKEMQAVENRIRHLQAENDDMEKEISTYDLKTRKVLEARQKKLDWEKQKRVEIMNAQEVNKQRRIELVEASKLRDQVISQRREGQGKATSKLMEEIQADRDVRDKLKEKVAEYERAFAEHRKLKALKDSKEHRNDHTYENITKKKEEKTKLEQKVRDEAQRLSEIDRRLERLKVLEQQMLEEKKQTMTQKGLLKSQFQDILNRKLDEKEIKDILAREKVARSPLGRSGSMTRLFEVPEEKTGSKPAGTKSRIVGLQSVAGSNKVDSSRGSITKSQVSNPSESKTGKSVEKAIGRDVPVSQILAKGKPSAKSPVPGKHQIETKTNHTPSIASPAGTPLGQKRASIKDSMGTPKGSASARVANGPIPTKKTDSAKPLAKEGKPTGYSNSKFGSKPTTMPLVTKSEVSKKSNPIESAKKPTSKPTETTKKETPKEEKPKVDPEEVKIVESRVEKIITDQDQTPDQPRTEEKEKNENTTTSQWEVAESPKQTMEPIAEAQTTNQAVFEETPAEAAQPEPPVEEKVQETPAPVEEKPEPEQTPVPAEEPKIEESLLDNLKEDDEFVFDGNPL